MTKKSLLLLLAAQSLVEPSPMSCNFYMGRIIRCTWTVNMRGKIPAWISTEARYSVSSISFTKKGIFHQPTIGMLTGKSQTWYHKITWSYPHTILEGRYIGLQPSYRKLKNIFTSDGWALTDSTLWSITIIGLLQKKSPGSGVAVILPFTAQINSLL